MHWKNGKEIETEKKERERVLARVTIKTKTQQYVMLAKEL